MDWNKIGALAGIATTILTAAMLTLMLWPPSKSEANSMVAVPLLVGACIVAGGYLNIKAALIHFQKPSAPKAPLDPYSDPRTLGLRILKEDLSYILEHYRPLDHDYPSRVRFPLLSASWPGFGEKWDYVNARLYSLSEMTSWTLTRMRKVWADNGWPEDEFRLFRETEMVNVLVGLQECIDWLKQKIEKDES
jgi:hypothetical protein